MTKRNTLATDPDGDGLRNGQERTVTHTSPYKADTDGQHQRGKNDQQGTSDECTPGYFFREKEGMKFMSLFGLSGKQQRRILRYSHLLAGMLNVFFIYTSLGDVWAFQLLVQITLVPVIIITGVWMWQQARVRKLIAKGLRQGEGQEGLNSDEPVEGEKKLMLREIGGHPSDNRAIRAAARSEAASRDRSFELEEGVRS